MNINLCPAALLDLFINSNFFAKSLGFSLYSMSSANNEVLLLSNLDAYYSLLSDCCRYDFQYYVEYEKGKWTSLSYS